ncbi:hypothetical protein GPECTOR_4g632 [Gonium pectorale]|uniref:SRCR domain-containing protein n=1 Tax=Gonium pectorale TaxID=33097 RepID=A0A150GXF0_GONPE|nr:hypothetical protein GPECTOR_4g632 [Gonium pectorale]|eukprot:KXZ54567.1 hypothetical protein GPECTOR_4g632 [Gonium pectorale]
MGLPTYGAVLIPPWELIPEDASLAMPAKMLGLEAGYMCGNALTAASAFDCDQVLVLPRVVRSCMAAAKQYDPYNNYRQAQRNFVPAGIACRGSGPPPPPPNASPPPPAPSPPPGLGPPAVNYTMRLTDRITGEETHSNGSRVTSGRLEVLLTPPGEGAPVWGTLCMSTWFPDAVAQYACKSLGLPYRSAWFNSRARYANFASLRSKPIHVVYMGGCQLRPDGLACDVVANFSDAREALRSGAAADERRIYYRRAMQVCVDPPEGRGHEADAFVTCDDSNPPPPNPPPPPPSPRPPYPPVAVRNDVQLNFTTYFDNVYGVEFGVRAPGSGETVWGSLCPSRYYQDYLNDRAAANSMCNQLSGGRWPVGVTVFLDRQEPPFLPPSAKRRDAPVVLTDLDCNAVPGIAPNISVCSAAVADPLPQHPSVACSSISWANRLLSCTATEYSNTPEVLSLRLVGGASASVGRLEVVMRSRLDASWGTVCGDTFNASHAQAVCRDLGLPWTRAAVLPASAVNGPAPPEQPVLIDNVGCFRNTPRQLQDTGRQPALSFMRDCYRQWWDGVLPDCGHESDVVVACEGEGGQGPDPSAPPPAPQPSSSVPDGTYGGYGVYCYVYGGYSGYGGYGVYGSYIQYGGSYVTYGDCGTGAPAYGAPPLPPYGGYTDGYYYDSY